MIWHEPSRAGRRCTCRTKRSTSPCSSRVAVISASLNDAPAAAKNSIALTADGVAHTAAYGLIETASNTRIEQVQAGILYARLSLHARTLGLVLQPLSQVLQEYPTMSGPYAEIRSDYAPAGQTLQMFVRIGTATTDYPLTMRRDAVTLVGAS